MRKITSIIIGGALALTVTTTTDAQEKIAFAGAGTQRCQFLNERAVPGRGSDQNLATQVIFTWAQGYMSGFNAHSLGIDKSSINLGAVSTKAQWEYLVSHCRSHPADAIVLAVMRLQSMLKRQ
jgi:hypothetical protein